MASVDFRFEDHGSVALIVPLNDDARAELAIIEPEDAQHWGDALVVEPRYVGGIVEVLDGDGFSVEDGRVD